MNTNFIAFVWAVICVRLGETTPLGSKLVCNAGKFACANGEGCLPPEYFCDGTPDCYDNSDEKGCKEGRDCKLLSCSYKCKQDEMGTSKCICDIGYHVGVDRKTCEDIDECKNEALCSQLCVNTPGSYHCKCQDDYILNLDGSCRLANANLTSKENFVACMDEKYPCANGLSCIPEEFLCDGGRDCSDGSDELGCENGVLCKIKKCNQQCKVQRYDVYHTDGWGNRVKSAEFEEDAICECYKGYRLLSDGKMEDQCVDIDECASGVCQQKCENTPGSFRCSCVDGYKLGSDNTSCEVGGRYPILMYSTFHELYLELIGTKRRYIMPLTSRDTVLEIAYFEETSEMYWLQTFVDGGFVRRATTSGTQTISTLLDKDFRNPEGLDIDWLNKKIYITDRSLGRIAACDMEGNQCVTVIRELGMLPTVIVLDVLNGEMYWINDGHPSQIFTSGMDGSSKKTLPIDIKSRLSDLAIDHTTRQIYWSTPDSIYVSHCSLDRPNDGTSTIEVEANIIKIAVFGDLLYYTSKDSGKLKGKNKRFQDRPSEVIATTSNSTTIMDIGVYHPMLHQRDNPCDTNTCSQVCLLAPNQTSSCSCFDRFKLAADGKTCNIRISLKDTKPEILDVDERTDGR